jgi:hypothetical protein
VAGHRGFVILASVAFDLGGTGISLDILEGQFDPT